MVVLNDNPQIEKRKINNENPNPHNDEKCLDKNESDLTNNISIVSQTSS
jgi:hypothetical protein